MTHDVLQTVHEWENIHPTVNRWFFLGNGCMRQTGSPGLKILRDDNLPIDPSLPGHFFDQPPRNIPV